jgi:hypothetical protein
MIANERLELVDQCRTCPEREVRFGPLLDRGETKLLQPDTLLLEKLPSAMSASGGPRQSESASRSRAAATVGSPAAKRLSPLVAQSFEAVEVDFVWVDPQAVSGRLGEQAMVRSRGGCEPATQARDVDLDHLRRTLGGPVVPEQVGQPVGRDALVSAQQQKCQERSLFARRHGKRPPVAHDFERTQNPKFDPLGRRHLALRLTPLFTAF